MEALEAAVPPCRTAGLASGETDLQELLQQIDVMVGQQKLECEEKIQNLKVQLEIRDCELVHSRAQVRALQQQAGEREQAHRETLAGYQQHLEALQSELCKLKDSYSKLLYRHVGQSSPAVDISLESTILTKKLKEYQSRSMEWEEQRLSYQKELAVLEASRRSLAAKCPLPQTSEELRVELGTRDDLLEATLLDEKTWREEAFKLQGKLLAVNNSSVKHEGQCKVMVSEFLQVSEKLEDTEQQLQKRLQKEVLLHKEISMLQEGLESSRYLARQLQDSIHRTESQLHSLEHDGKRKDNEIVKLRQELSKLHLESSKKRESRSKQEEVAPIPGPNMEYQVVVCVTAPTASTADSQEQNTEIHPDWDELPSGGLQTLSEISSGAHESSKEEPSGAAQGFHRKNQLSTCWEKTDASGRLTVGCCVAAPVDSSGCHDNQHNREESVADQGGESLEPHSQDDTKMLSPRPKSLAVERFFTEEERRVKDLEQRFDAYLHRLSVDTLSTLQKYSFGSDSSPHTTPAAPVCALLQESERFSNQSGGWGCNTTEMFNPWQRGKRSCKPE